MKVIIQDNLFKVKLCTTPQSISDGMSNKNFDNTFNGMLFIFPNVGKQNFWMYDCLVPLDIIMIEGNTISKIHHNCPPCDEMDLCDRYSGICDRVLEVSGGTCEKLGISDGDLVSFSLY